jgi:hypothetical protein
MGPERIAAGRVFENACNRSVAAKFRAGLRPAVGLENGLRVGGNILKQIKNQPFYVLLAYGKSRVDEIGVTKLRGT